MKARRGQLVFVATLALLAAGLPGPAAETAVLARRICAEWEPALGTLIAWPLRIPERLVVDLTREGDVFVLVTSKTDAAARAGLGGLAVDPGKIHYIPSSVEDEWTRDYGPHQVFDERGRLTVVDPTYIDTPFFLADSPPTKKGGWIDYPGRGPGDDRTNAEFARFRNLPIQDFPGFLTGGNFLVDGHGIAFSTRAMLDENLSQMSEQDFRALVRETTGVADLRVLHNTEIFGIQHIDCWFKLLDEETILVKRAPEGHPERRRLEQNLNALREMKTCFGRPYRILFIDCPEFGDGKLAAYTNSLILNRSVYVPLFGIPEDAQALETWRSAMPGYEVCGYRYEHWYDNDALHCRTRAVFDPGMLSMSHRRLREGDPLVVRARILDYSGKGLVADELRLRWRVTGATEWKTVRLVASGKTDEFQGTIATADPGQTVEYYVSAVSHSGRRETLPRTAPDGFYVVRIVN